MDTDQIGSDEVSTSSDASKSGGPAPVDRKAGAKAPVKRRPRAKVVGGRRPDLAAKGRRGDPSFVGNMDEIGSDEASTSSDASKSCGPAPVDRKAGAKAPVKRRPCAKVVGGRRPDLAAKGRRGDPSFVGNMDEIGSDEASTSSDASRRGGLVPDDYEADVISFLRQRPQAKVIDDILEENSSDPDAKAQSGRLFALADAYCDKRKIAQSHRDSVLFFANRVIENFVTEKMEALEYQKEIDHYFTRGKS